MDDTDLTDLADAATAPAAAGRLLDVSAHAADGLWSLDAEVRTARQQAADAGLSADAPGALLLAAAADAITYRVSSESGRCTFQPHLQLPDGTTRPLRVDEQPDDVTERWQGLLTAVTAPVWRSRLAHLLTATTRVAGRERVDLAHQAIGDYLSVPSTGGWELDHIDALRAALALSRQFGLPDRRPDVLAAALVAARQALVDQPDAAGIVLGLTQILVDDPDAPDDIDDLLASVRTVYAGDPHRTDDVIEQQLTRARRNDARRAALWRERVETWLAAAAACGDIRRAHFLQVAVQHATTAGDPSLRQRPPPGCRS